MNGKYNHPSPPPSDDHHEPSHELLEEEIDLQLIDPTEEWPTDASPTLREVRFSHDGPVRVILWRGKLVRVALHYQDETQQLERFFRCLGKRCPYCRVGNKPTIYLLLPVFTVAANEVQVLKMPDNRKPNGLFAQLRPLLRDPQIAQKMVMITKADRFRYMVLTKPLKPGMNLGAAQMAEFGEALEAKRLSLASLYPVYEAEELEAIPSVRYQLEAEGLAESVDPFEGDLDLIDEEEPPQ